MNSKVFTLFSVVVFIISVGAFHPNHVSGMNCDEPTATERRAKCIAYCMEIYNTSGQCFERPHRNICLCGNENDRR